MELKSLIVVFSLVAVGFCNPTSTSDVVITPHAGACDEFFECLEPLIDDILEFRNALDLFQFNITYSESWLRDSCTLHPKLTTCLTPTVNTTCASSTMPYYHSLNQELLKGVCDHTDQIKTSMGCWTDGFIQETLLDCYVESYPPTCQQEYLSYVSECQTDEAKLVYSVLLDTFLKYD